MVLPAIYRRYLSILGVPEGPPTFDLLCRLVRAHLERVPFENLSKLYYLKTRDLRGIPDLALYLDGIERDRFGGTCYSNNPYLHDLLAQLGYDVSLCGADMSSPDLHIVITVRVEGREYLVDVGYGAPFEAPMPRDLDRDLEVRLGDERWVLAPQDARGRSAVHHFRDAERIHGYLAKPEPRTLDQFQPVILGSYRPDATFMTRARVIAFARGASLQLADLTLVRSTPHTSEVTRLASPEAALRAIEERFGVSEKIARIALAGVGPFGASP